MITAAHAETPAIRRLPASAVRYCPGDFRLTISTKAPVVRRGDAKVEGGSQMTYGEDERST
jgi:hypothetical protein